MSNSNAKPGKRTRFDDLVACLLAAENHTRQRLWIAYSGGLDSSVLLSAAASAYPAARLGVVHVNHQISPHADAWQAHCEKVAQASGLEFIAKRIDIASAPNLEVAGRLARQQVFKELIVGGGVVATAHHYDDEIESLLWQLATGRALVGIAPKRRLGNGLLWRPLLAYSRRTLREIAQTQRLVWIEDESNRDTSLTRNALRLDILPQLRKTFPDFEARLLERKFPALQEMPRAPIDVKALKDAYCVRSWLFAYDITPRDAVVSQVLAQAHARNDAKVQIRVASHATVRRFRGYFFVVSDAEESPPSNVVVGRRTFFRFGELTWLPGSGGLQPGQKLTVRKREGGETIRIHEKNIKISHWFQREKVPPWERDDWPLLCVDNRLVAVPGLGIQTGDELDKGLFPDWRPLTARV